MFLHRLNDEKLSIRIRSPVADTFRFEVVGKDVTVTDPTYDYDWIAIFKLVFGNDNDDCEPFPECPIIGWGPGRATMECGLAPMSHFAGEIKQGKDDSGKIEVRFSTTSDKDWNKMQIHGELVQGGSSGEKIPDHVVHRVEDGDVIFNVNTPQAGEYALKLYAKGEKDKDSKNICNYLISSDQKEHNPSFPRGFADGIGPKPAFDKMGIRALTYTSGYIETDEEVVELKFQKPEGVELSLSLSGNSIRPEMAKRLVDEETDGDITTYKVRLPSNGSYGVKVMANAGKGNINVFDYVIIFKKNLKKKTYKPAAEVKANKEEEPPPPPPAPESSRDRKLSLIFAIIPPSMKSKTRNVHTERAPFVRSSNPYFFHPTAKIDCYAF